MGTRAAMTTKSAYRESASILVLGKMCANQRLDLQRTRTAMQEDTITASVSTIAKEGETAPSALQKLVPRETVTLECRVINAQTMEFARTFVQANQTFVVLRLDLQMEINATLDRMTCVRVISATALGTMPSVAHVVSNLVKLGPNHIQVHVDKSIQLAAATTKVTMSGMIKNVLRLKKNARWLDGNRKLYLWMLQQRGI